MSTKKRKDLPSATRALVRELVPDMPTLRRSPQKEITTVLAGPTLTHAYSITPPHLPPVLDPASLYTQA